jgi:hypothetical protein
MKPIKSKVTLRVIEPGARACGDCHECCIVYDVEEFNAPAFDVCPNLSQDGCRVYASRPPRCQEFNCLWLVGMGEVGDRPDKVGVVFSATTTGLPVAPVHNLEHPMGRALAGRSRAAGFTVAVDAVETREGAANELAAKRLLATVGKIAPVFLRGFGMVDGKDTQARTLVASRHIAEQLLAIGRR